MKQKIPPEAQQRHPNPTLTSLLARLAPHEGYNLSALPDVRFLRSNRPLATTPVLYDPGIVIVCQGRKRGFFGDEVYLYDASHYLAVSVPVPFTMETDASAAEPLLAIYMHLDFRLAADLMLEIDRHGGAAPSEPRGMLSTPMDASMQASVLRFLQAMSDPMQAAILGPSLVRELYFHVLAGEQGHSLRAALTMQGQFGKIARALRRIHAAYTQALDVDSLARESGMSVPSFHAHFRNVTRTSPMQYLKSTRLHQARLLMVRNGITAAAASGEVGYESPSQFSREFKRLFGRSPVEEVRRMKAEFAIPPPHAGSPFVSSH
ncbi:AraC family transcriptional regulator [Herbaspirillum sp. LeCh32-8]|uniref:AraC family transcriptional regulator n=1 Tax=Herbaspirillum sp. LeCh32-8 TaxID=2821356 RepID=UPI001FD7BEEB|nr:AraC family transcriptional regulator [Herbaspirillum sp. LeCh32-8]